MSRALLSQPRLWPNPQGWSDVPTVLWCSRCDCDLPTDAFAPSHRSNGNWCRACRKAYMAQYNAERAVRSVCTRCRQPFDRPTPLSRQRICGACRSKPRRRRTRNPSQTWQGRAARELRAEVLATESLCGFCGEPVDKTLHHLHPNGPTVDHIIPRAVGGALLDRNNVRLAHRSCNSRAGAQLANRALDRLLYARAALWIGSSL